MSDFNNPTMYQILRMINPINTIIFDKSCDFLLGICFLKLLKLSFGCPFSIGYFICVSICRMLYLDKKICEPSNPISKNIFPLFSLILFYINNFIIDNTLSVFENTLRVSKIRLRLLSSNVLE